MNELKAPYEAMGCRLRNMRLAVKKTERDVSEGTGIAVSIIKKVEEGNRDLSIEELLLLSSFYGTTVNYIVMGFDDSIKDKKS